jgi:hypothetical protein
MKTPLQELIEQLEQKIEKANEFINKQDESVGLSMSIGVLAGFSEAKVMAEKILEKEKINQL